MSALPPSRRPGAARPRSQPGRTADGKPGALPGIQAGGKTPPGAATTAAREAREARDARQARAARVAARAAPAVDGVPAASKPARPPASISASTSASTRAGAKAAVPRWLWGTAAGALLLMAGALLWAWQGPHAAPQAAAATATLRQLSIAELLAGHSPDWRVARLQEDPGVVVIEFPTLAEQGAAMNRMAALLEKAGAPRDRVLGNDELAALIQRSGDNSQTFYQGHDYNGAGLARFYALAHRQGLKLNIQEDRVRDELLGAGLLAQGEGGVLHEATGQGVQAIITFTATQPDDPATPFDETVDAARRESILRHEASHGRFYTRPVYREHCRRFWREALTDAQREHLRVYLASVGYNRDDEDLMLNEAQAFMMNTPDVRAFTAQGIGLTDGELADLRTRFWRTLPPEGDNSRVPAAFSPAGRPAVQPAPSLTPAPTPAPASHP